MSIRKPPEFQRFEDTIVGFCRDKLAVVKARGVYDARDLDAAIELLVDMHRLNCRSVGNPDALFRVRLFELEGIQRIE